MSKAHITDFIRSNPRGLATAEFMEASEDYLGLHHGDTTSHPYVHADLHANHIVADVKAAFVAVTNVVKASVGTSSSALNWHAQYCLNKFGKTTPGL
jgi:hypothetical protein